MAQLKPKDFQNFVDLFFKKLKVLGSLN